MQEYAVDFAYLCYEKRRLKGIDIIKAIVLCISVGFLTTDALGQDVLDVAVTVHSEGGQAEAGQVDFSWFNTYGKSPTEFTIEEWRSIIDASWGDGLDTSAKLALFDTWWNEIDTRFGAFHGIDLDLNALRDRYRPEIEAGVSKGRFSGIMTQFTYQLKEMHTYLFDIPLRNTSMNKGVPMLSLGLYGNNRRFGALLTPLEDSTLVVYEALSGHPIGLERGDLVLGYDGVRWKDIYPRLFEAELPLFLNPVHASTDEGNYHYAMQSAGLNWHLFDTLDVVKYSSGDTLHFDTNLLSNLTPVIWGKEQIPPPGVPWPSRTQGNRVGWGIIDNTNIGMVTVTSWSFDAQFDIRAKFENAVDDMMNVHDADGIIFDFRYNTGGGALAREGLQLLFNEAVPTVGFDRRVAGSADHFVMEPDPLRREANLVIQGSSGSYYAKPIAILIGPGSISAGELEARRMSFHSLARIFGLPAGGGNTGSDFISIGDSNWFVSRANSAQYLASNREYITRTALQPDERVWFERDDVAQGVDTVIKAAMDWISTHPTAVEETPGEAKLSPNDFSITAFPNPFDDQVTLEIKLASPAVVKMELYDVLGRHIYSLLDDQLPPGSHRFSWNGLDAAGNEVAPGIYFWRLKTDEHIDSGRFVKTQ